MSNKETMVSYSVGGQNRGKVKNVQTTWKEFCEELAHPKVTSEKLSAYRALTADEKHALKAEPGYIMSAPMKDGLRRNDHILPRMILSLDIDNADPRLPADIENGFTNLSHYEFVSHSTRSSTAKQPRIRVFLLANRLVTADEFKAVSRLLGWKLEDYRHEVLQVDSVSYRAAQMMYKPSISRDQDYWHFVNPGETVDIDGLFAEYREKTGLDPFDVETQPRHPGEKNLREAAKKAEDPTTKSGIIGTFCRMWDVPAAIEHFELPYTPSDESGTGKERYTYIHGSTADGAEIEDGGLFMYSFHGTDPVADRLVNSFDLTRIHLFGGKDAKVDEAETPPTKMPSYIAMKEMLEGDEAFQRARLDEKIDVNGMFADLPVDSSEENDEAPALEAEAEPEDEEEEDLLGFDEDPIDPSDPFDSPDARAARERTSGAGNPAGNSKPAEPQKTKPGKRPKAPDVDTWFPAQLELDQNQNIKPTPNNAATLIFNDRRTVGSIAFNEFTQQIVLRFDILSNIPTVPVRRVKDRINGDRWQDIDDISLRMMLSEPNDPGRNKYGYGVQITDRDMNAAVHSCARRNAFHPIRDYLKGLTWDGVRRIESLFTRYLGTPDTPYHREVPKLMLTASVARIMEPGHKFDNAAIIEGEQGIRKSSFIRTLYSDAWFGEIDCDLGNPQQVAETIGGIWGGELPEMTSFHKSEFNAAKAFMRRQTDSVRMAYERRVTEFDRQIVLWGTTNDQKYLKDPTGNRSYWPVRMNLAAAECFAVVEGKRQIDTNEIKKIRDQLWAEAFALYTEMRAKTPAGEDLALVLTAKAADEAEILQEGARVADLHETWGEMVQDWLDAPIPMSQYRREIGLEPDDSFADEHDDPLVLRCAVTREMILAGALHKDRGVQDYQTNQNFAKTMPMIKGWDRELVEKTDGKMGGRKPRVQGLQRRWIFRESITVEEKKLGYRIVPPDDEITEDEIIDLV